MTSEVDICNIALSALGEKRITSLSDDTVAARFCNTNYAATRDSVVESSEWTFSIKRATLAPLSTGPDWGYTYAYQVPADCLTLKTVKSSTQVNTPNGLDWVREGDQILCDANPIYIRYQKQITDTSLFSAAFVKALASRLAWDLAIPICQSRGMDELATTKFTEELAIALASDGQQGRSKKIRSTRLTRVRELDGDFDQYAGPTV